ncbi:hypothetical protein HK405_002680 [Cladochytrium tenue]|nr:hypothetical protein HK405_002680 [Cladochytrium tenue]
MQLGGEGAMETTEFRYGSITAASIHDAHGDDDDDDDDAPLAPTTQAVRVTYSKASSAAALPLGALASATTVGKQEGRPANDPTSAALSGLPRNGGIGGCGGSDGADGLPELGGNGGDGANNYAVLAVASAAPTAPADADDDDDVPLTRLPSQTSTRAPSTRASRAHSTLGFGTAATTTAVAGAGVAMDVAALLASMESNAAVMLGPARVATPTAGAAHGGAGTGGGSVSCDNDDDEEALSRLTSARRSRGGAGGSEAAAAAPRGGDDIAAAGPARAWPPTASVRPPSTTIRLAGAGRASASSGGSVAATVAVPGPGYVMGRRRRMASTGSSSSSSGFAGLATAPAGTLPGGGWHSGGGSTPQLALQQQLVEALEPASRALAVGLSALVLLQLEPWLRQTSRSLQRLETSVASGSDWTLAGSNGNGGSKPNAGVTVAARGKEGEESGAATAGEDDAALAYIKASIDSGIGSMLSLRGGRGCSSGQASSVRGRSAASSHASLFAAASSSGAGDGPVCEACGAKRMTQPGSLLAELPSRQARDRHSSGAGAALDPVTGQPVRGRPLLAAERDAQEAAERAKVAGSLAFRQQAAAAAQRVQELREREARARVSANAGGGDGSVAAAALLAGRGLRGEGAPESDIEAVPRRLTCPKCEGLGFLHTDHRRKHDKPKTQQCKRCQMCPSCTGTGILINSVDCRVCNGRGYEHKSTLEGDTEAALSSEQHKRCGQCTDCTACAGIGIVSVVPGMESPPLPPAVAGSPVAGSDSELGQLLPAQPSLSSLRHNAAVQSSTLSTAAAEAVACVTSVAPGDVIEEEVVEESEQGEGEDEGEVTEDEDDDDDDQDDDDDDDGGVDGEAGEQADGRSVEDGNGGRPNLHATC